MLLEAITTTSDIFCCVRSPELICYRKQPQSQSGDLSNLLSVKQSSYSIFGTPSQHSGTCHWHSLFSSLGKLEGMLDRLDPERWQRPTALGSGPATMIYPYEYACVKVPFTTVGKPLGTYQVLETSLLISKGFENTLSPACFA